MFYEGWKAFGVFICSILFPTKRTFEAPIPEEGPLILCGKHISNADGPLSLLFFPRKVNFMAKMELFKIPVVGPFIRKMGAFPVVRGKNDVGAVKTALQVLKSGGVLGIFPEGTCVKNNDRGPVKPGAFNLALKTKATIIPFGIYTKNWRRRFFKPSRMSFGKPMTYEELFGDGGKEKLKEVEQIVMTKVYDLSEKDYECPRR